MFRILSWCPPDGVDCVVRCGQVGHGLALVGVVLYCGGHGVELQLDRPAGEAAVEWLDAAARQLLEHAAAAEALGRRPRDCPSPN